MSLGEKLKECRKNAGLSQEQLAEKLCVSRQAITKWETDRGMPNIESLQGIAKLFDVSVDYLLDDGNTLSGNVMKESIHIEEYEQTGKCRSKYDAVAKAKFPNARSIIPLIRRKKMSKIERVIDFIVQPGVLHVADSLNDLSAYYVVELDNRQLLVHITKDFIESNELVSEFSGKRKVIGTNLFIKATYAL
ncbi:transcriptional regulator with XRE-family HTH domain [Sporosarcina luteola]|nr:transcriptional regulator with XRE-family HTH domain [Sporosarcina luteola]